MRPILVTGIARSGGSWVSTMLAASGQVVHVNEPLNRRHPPGLSPGILRIPPPLAYQYIAGHNEHRFRSGYADLFRLRYHLAAELDRNHCPYDLAKAAKSLASFTRGRLAHRTVLIDDPYAVFSAEWLHTCFDCR